MTHRKLTDRERSLLKLIARSNADADGWCNVSPQVYPVIKDIDSELAEVGDLKIRLTETERTLVNWT